MNVPHDPTTTGVLVEGGGVTVWCPEHAASTLSVTIEPTTRARLWPARVLRRSLTASRYPHRRARVSGMRIASPAPNNSTAPEATKADWNEIVSASQPAASGPVIEPASEAI